MHKEVVLSFVSPSIKPPQQRLHFIITAMKLLGSQPFSLHELPKEGLLHCPNIHSANLHVQHTFTRLDWHVWSSAHFWAISHDFRGHLLSAPESEKPPHLGAGVVVDCEHYLFAPFLSLQAHGFDMNIHRAFWLLVLGPILAGVETSFLPLLWLSI